MLKMKEIDPARYDGHTPGPWSACINVHTIQVDIGAKPHGHRPCVVEWGGFDSSDLPKCEQRANARLIADAPMLLDKVLELQAENERLREETESDRRILRDPDLVLLYILRGVIALPDIYVRQSHHGELIDARAEIARLRSLIPVWVTVTEDPATLPEENRSILIKSRIGSNDFVTFYRFGRVLRPGDRWCPVPTLDPKVANSQSLTPDQTTQTQEASHE